MRRDCAGRADIEVKAGPEARPGGNRPGPAAGRPSVPAASVPAGAATVYLAKALTGGIHPPVSTPAPFQFIDLFAGIGGMRLPFEKLGGECVFTSEWDKFAVKTTRPTSSPITRSQATSPRFPRRRSRLTTCCSRAFRASPSRLPASPRRTRWAVRTGSSAGPRDAVLRHRPDPRPPPASSLRPRERQEPSQARQRPHVRSHQGDSGGRTRVHDRLCG